MNCGKIVEAIRKNRHSDGRTATNLAQSLAEYWTEERPVIAGSEAVREFVQAVDVLRDDTERLEKRVERLSSRAIPRSGS